ncbi:hypothetical protein DL764_003908 [Monosporascus ibericus]|uniref:CipC-like antibiotic response protein n=1 Tax=Monosporascus ibericus TaxID=155417 RepID=A0A4Q4TIC7_9PEZI|nr:hypothetical protein DL764_003908 [Monosporascus ibericus]
MFGFDEAKNARDEVYSSEPREAKFSHELVAGGAAFEAMKIFEDRQRSEGKAVSHGFAKELLAGIAGAELDKLVETKSMDAIDREKAKRHAKQQAEQMYDQHYGSYDQYDPERSRRHPTMEY